jgi:hypothetical protein
VIGGSPTAKDACHHPLSGGRERGARQTATPSQPSTAQPNGVRGADVRPGRTWYGVSLTGLDRTSSGGGARVCAGEGGRGDGATTLQGVLLTFTRRWCWKGTEDRCTPTTSASSSTTPTRPPPASSTRPAGWLPRRSSALRRARVREPPRCPRPHPRRGTGMARGSAHPGGKTTRPRSIRRRSRTSRRWPKPGKPMRSGCASGWPRSTTRTWTAPAAGGRPLWQCLAHVVNHGTQHRSEAAMVLTHWGQSPGELDLIYYPAEWEAIDAGARPSPTSATGSSLGALVASPRDLRPRG